GAGPSADDGFLTASEIADLELPADFVALSACNTANLAFTRIAQDLPALSSAFAQAGAHATLGTLWPVNSETGATVVADVFARLADPTSLGPADALAQAQRAYLAAPPSRARLHPRFWAPFIILGDGAQRPRQGGVPARTPARGLPSRAAGPGSS
ncbi:MAG TPA: CHAT domain-containing protein, partial [Phenylobacterium sp.]